jgi:DMSO/TMAO reductase YedYZ molybdopterin-dependent catalytic subunit
VTSPIDIVRQARHWWPRRAPGLPPGQRALDAFPRFADDPRRPPPAAPPRALRITSTATEEVTIGFDELRRSTHAGSIVADFHCVTTWTARRRTWTGVPLRRWWTTSIGPLPTEPFAVVDAADGYGAVFLTDDLFADGVMLAWALDGEPLDRRHGASMRLVSPAQYGYKNVKHVESITLHHARPTSRLGAKEHLRARVELEERHSRIPGRLLRWPYRVAVPITAIVAERTLARLAPADAATDGRARAAPQRPGP